MTNRRFMRRFFEVNMEYYLYLLQIFGGGNPLIHKIIELYGSPQKAVKAIISGDLSAVGAKYMGAVNTASLKTSEMIISYCKNNSIDIITIDDESYPVRLKNIFNPPVLLFVHGNLKSLSAPLSISIVGPRKPTEYGRELAHNISNGLSRCGIATVSGLAYGIDNIVHNAAISYKMPTIGVLACGITIEYPEHSFPLRREIIKNGGAIISELLPDVKCSPEYFRTRNRIISGLSNGTCIINGNNKSGSILTARHAFEQDRELFFTIPESTLDPECSAIIRYLRDGAHPVYDFYDIVNEFYGEYENVIDATFLDKNKMLYLPKAKAKEETLVKTVPEVKPAKAEEKPKPSPKKEEKPLKPKAPENPIVFKVKLEHTQQDINYRDVTPERFLKKSKPKPAPKENPKPVTEEIKETKPEEIKEVSDENPVYERILQELSKGACTPDHIMEVLNISYGEIFDILTDLEISEKIESIPGGRYKLK